jgi:hypothetical protein
VSRAGAGVLRVTATGMGADRAVQSMSDGSLLLRVRLPDGLQTALGIGDSGLGLLSLSKAGLLLELENQPVYRLLPSEGGEFAALLLKPLLEQVGAQVLITRTSDERVLSSELMARLGSISHRTQADLAARSAIANAAEVDLVLSIHANGGPQGDGGTETFWALNSLNPARSQHLARLIRKH